jgi:D-glycero-D-manno-heptose 1,7-bisphosphate phosphatase
MNKVIFLDRDGVLNLELGHYVTSVNEWTPNPGAVSFLKQAALKGYRFCVITNQGGIGKGLYTHDILREIHHKMAEIYAQEHIFFDAIFYCPHHPEADGHCLCRKPGHLMVQKGIHLMKAHTERSWMIGDSQRDVDAAASAGIKGVRVPPNSALHHLVHMLD